MTRGEIDRPSVKPDVGERVDREAARPNTTPEAWQGARLESPTREPPSREAPSREPDREPQREPPGRGPPSRPRRRFPFIGTVLTILIVGGLLVFAYHALVPQTKPETRGRGASAGGAPQSVGAATIGRGDIDVEIQALGTVTPLANITVKTQINGQLLAVGFKEGQVVQKGDFLAQIDPRPYEALEHQYEGQLAHDQGLLAEAKIDLARYQTLLNQTSIARQTTEDQVYVVQQDEGTVESDKALIEAQKVNLIYCHITAPVTGRVGLRQVDPGNYVQTTDTNGLVVLTQLQPISVIFSLPENAVPEVVEAAKANPNLEAEAFDQANLNKLATGHLNALDNVIDTTTGQLKGRAVFENPSYDLFPNQFVNIHLKVGTLHNVVVAPNAAVQRGSPGTFAYVIGADGKVSVRKITLGSTEGSMVEVTDGLAVGDRVVIDGSDRLRDGARVNVAGEPPGGGARGRPGNGQPGDGQSPARSSANGPNQGHRHHNDQH